MVGMQKCWPALSHIPIDSGGQGEQHNYEHMPEKRTGQKLWSLL